MNNQTENINNLDSIIQHLEKKDAILKLLHQHKIAKIKSVESVERYKKDANRGGLIITGKEEINGPIEKILIDFKLGKPCIAQVFDSIYEIGKRCSKRIIMFGGVGKNEVIDPATDEHVVESLITTMNDYPLNLSLVQLDCSKFETKLFDMDLSTRNFFGSEFSIKDLPSKTRFREAEFWDVYFNSLREKYYYPSSAFNYVITNKSQYGKCIHYFALKFKVEWTNDGAFFTVMQRKAGTSTLKEIWQTKKDELQQLSQDNETRFKYLPGKFHKIETKLWNYPLKCLVSASNAEKMEFAKLLHSKYFDLDRLMDFKLWGMIDPKPMPERL